MAQYVFELFGLYRGHAMNDSQRCERLQIILTAVELEAMDSWRFARRMPSGAWAVREFLRRGLAAEGFDLVKKGSRSEDFGVTGTPTSSPTRDRHDGKEQSK